MCDDGGYIVLCSICDEPFCYNERKTEGDALTTTEDELASEACITFPPGFCDDESRIFRCPICLAASPERAIDADLVLVVASLREHTDRAAHIYGAIKSLLSSFEMNVVCFEMTLPEHVPAASIKDVVSSEDPYHFAFIFLTESDVAGGWWWDNNASCDESEWIAGILQMYSGIAEKALSARVFGLCCGVNLGVPGVVKNIVDSLTGSHWDSMVLPGASSVMPEEFGCMLPEVFLQLYYNSRTPRSSIVGVWSKSKRCRFHSDLVIIDHAKDPAARSVQKYTFAPRYSRPWGVSLPVARSFCKCGQSNSEITWKRRSKSDKTKFGESFAVMVSSCKHFILYLAVFVGDLETIDMSGTVIVAQRYDDDRGYFPLDSYDRFKIKVTLAPNVILHRGPKGTRYEFGVNSACQARPFQHDSPWTVAGKAFARIM
ncbi:hypothetical protein FRC08_004352 [Ceratobasidium sp. 394]|nr:hypothetical protein FRC08_004352 [Ceratobasidium sp. 394]